MDSLELSEEFRASLEVAFEAALPPLPDVARGSAWRVRLRSASGVARGSPEWLRAGWRRRSPPVRQARAARAWRCRRASWRGRPKRDAREDADGEHAGRKRAGHASRWRAGAEEGGAPIRCARPASRCCPVGPRTVPVRRRIGARARRRRSETIRRQKARSRDAACHVLRRTAGSSAGPRRARRRSPRIARAATLCALALVGLSRSSGVIVVGQLGLCRWCLLG